MCCPSAMCYCLETQGNLRTISCDIFRSHEDTPKNRDENINSPSLVTLKWYIFISDTNNSTSLWDILSVFLRGPLEDLDAYQKVGNFYTYCPQWIVSCFFCPPSTAFKLYMTKDDTDICGQYLKKKPDTVISKSSIVLSYCVFLCVSYDSHNKVRFLH